MGTSRHTSYASLGAGASTRGSAQPGRSGRTASDGRRSRGTGLNTFLRSFRWGHVRQLDRVSRELLGRAWAAGAGPGSDPFTIALDSRICETYGLQTEGDLHHGYTDVRGYHPLLAVAAGTADILIAHNQETLRRRLVSLTARLTRSARRWRPPAGSLVSWAIEFSTALARLRAIPLLA